MELDMAAHAEGRSLLLTQSHGVLSTISVEIEGGYPFGSLTPYAIDAQGMPIVMMATIAQHRKNVQKHPQVSLLCYDVANPDVQAAARLTIVGQAHRLESVAADGADRYLRVFPEARGYATAHNFEFYQIQPTAIRYIGGFGRIHWLEASEVCRANPFDKDAERAIVEHMNEDHQHNLRQYMHAYAGTEVAEDEELQMVSIDAEGFVIRRGPQHHRIQFLSQVQNSQDARRAMIELARGVRK